MASVPNNVFQICLVGFFLIHFSKLATALHIASCVGNAPKIKLDRISSYI